MFKLAYNPAFLRDVKHYDMGKLFTAKNALLQGDTQSLRTRYHDHQLTGNLSSFCELHIEVDWLLLYRFEDDTIILARTETHDGLL